MSNISEPSFAPVTLEAAGIRLEPLSLAQTPQLLSAGSDRSIFQWYPMALDSDAALSAWIAEAVEHMAKGLALAFAMIEKSSGLAVGSSRFAAIDRAHRRAEIGWTWISPRLQRSYMNTQAKFLMLQHAFETLGLNRVEFKTDSLNAKSRAALARIGAVEEGTFRNHMITHSGRVRHSVYFSVTNTDWPQVKTQLESKLAQHGVGRV